MSELITEPNIDRPDDVYQWLIDMHAGYTEEESHQANARLILLLINHVGDRAAIRQAIDLARDEGPRSSREKGHE